MNGVARKNSPSTMIVQPATSSSVWRCSLSDEPSAVAASPSTMKIAEKLAQNSRLGPSTLRSGALSRSFGMTPVTADR